MDRSIAVSFRAGFEAAKLTANTKYQMEKILTNWLRDLISATDTSDPHEKLNKASGMNIPEFWLAVIADLSTAREDKIMEDAKEGQPT